MAENEKKVKTKKKTYSITFKANKNGKHYSHLLNFFRIIFIPFYYLLRPFRYYGAKRKHEGSCIYVCNHYTLLDVAYVASMTWEGVHFLAKKSVLEAPVIKHIAKAVKVIGANRDGNDVRALLDCFKCLKNGDKLSVFPEGTRNKTDAEILPFRHGAAVMAIKAKAPIIPMMLYSRPKFFRVAHILVGEPIELTEYYDRKLTEADYAEADDKILQYMLNMKREHTAYLENKKRKKK